MAYRALLDQLLDGAGDLLDRHVGIDAMLVEQVDPVGAQPPQRVLDARTDRLRAAVEPGLAAGAEEVEAELGRDHDLVADWFERLTDQLLVVERPVHLRGVEQGDTAFHRRPQPRDPVFPFGKRRKRMSQAHAAKPDRGDLEAASERACVHQVLLFLW